MPSRLSASARLVRLIDTISKSEVLGVEFTDENLDQIAKDAKALFTEPVRRLVDELIAQLKAARKAHKHG
jgi:hypothetical protein